MKRNRILLLLMLILTALLFAQCRKEKQSKSESTLVNYRGWEDIIASDTLRVGTITSPTVYYMMRDQNFGFEYQKISEFSNSHDLVLDLRISNSIDSLLILLEQGEVDLCITPLPITKSNQSRYSFAGLVDTTSLVLVKEKSDSTIYQVTDLANQSIYVENNSAAEVRVHQLMEEIGYPINMISIDTLSSEELFEKIGKDSMINYVVSDNRSASTLSSFYPDLDMSLQLSAPVMHAWVVDLGNSTLKSALDTFFCTPEMEKHYDQLLEEDSHFRHYYRTEAPASTVYQMKDGDISPYDSIFKSEAKRLGWHWTYLAAIAYHESTFRSSVVGRSGARGLMGIMPSTGSGYGASAEQLLDPAVSVRVAVDCLLEYGERFKSLPDFQDQVCFTLASYNAGNGHILDAIRLAEKYNAPTDKWFQGVREYVILKSNPKYYNDPVVKFGYMRGKETVNYVDDILHRQSLFQSIAK